MSQAYPLHWPQGWPRTQSPTTSRFDTSITKAMNNVEGALKKFAADSGKKIESYICSSNFSLSDRTPKDSGVAIYFTWDGLQTCIAVDRYKAIEDNLQAIYHCIEAERTKLRHGGINLVKAAFRGYAALPPPSSGQGRHWTKILNVGINSSWEEIKEAWKAAAMKAHPDKGGSSEAMAEVNRAYDQAKAEKGA